MPNIFIRNAEISLIYQAVTYKICLQHKLQL